MGVCVILDGKSLIGLPFAGKVAADVSISFELGHKNGNQNAARAVYCDLLGNKIRNKLFSNLAKEESRNRI